MILIMRQQINLKYRKQKAAPLSTAFLYKKYYPGQDAMWLLTGSRSRSFIGIALLYKIFSFNFFIA